MLDVLPPTASSRKFRLVVCQMLRHDHTVNTADARKSIELGERLADGEATDEEVLAFSRATLEESDCSEWSALTANSRMSVQVYISSGPDPVRARVPHLLRECFGNPFRPVSPDPAWLTTTVVALAEGIYAERAFDRMPILADALQDADCTNDDVLSHCRGPVEGHLRGCWVIDLLTGRA